MEGRLNGIVKDRDVSRHANKTGQAGLSCGSMPQRGLAFRIAGGLFLAMMVAMPAACSKGSSTEELNAMKATIARLEGRLAKVEGDDRKITRLENEMKGLQASMSNLNRIEKSLKDQLSSLGERFEALQKEVAQAEAKAEIKKMTPEKISPVAGAPKQGRYYVVQHGDTLFRIAGKHNLTLDELRRLNHLTKDQYIFPGQKLLVATE